jgi:hypothetical protein
MMSMGYIQTIGMTVVIARLHQRADADCLLKERTPTA